MGSLQVGQPRYDRPVKDLVIDEDIRKAATLPAEVYRDPLWLERMRERVFARSWQLCGDTDCVRERGRITPVTLLEKCLDEPLLLSRDASGQLHCLSNVCTHRGNVLVQAEGAAQALRCRYHGRRFGLDGRCLSMPEFEEVVGFPAASDNLPRVALESWGRLLFANLAPSFAFEEALAPMRARVGWMPLDEFVLDEATSREYHVHANWALYCDNYLEGFHIPFVHAGLADVIDYGAYRTELSRWGSLQLGVAAEGEDAFELPPSSPDFGSRIAAYYFWMFPNTMFNFYPWGLSVNVVITQGVAATKVLFLSYVWDETKRNRGAGAALDRVELEDEEIVEQVQRGVSSRLYDRGRYSPTRETGVHHFHRLLAEQLR